MSLANRLRDVADGVRLASLSDAVENQAAKLLLSGCYDAIQSLAAELEETEKQARRWRAMEWAANSNKDSDFCDTYCPLWEDIERACGYSGCHFWWAAKEADALADLMEKEIDTGSDLE